MDKELLKKAFREYKKAAGLDYAITNPANLGGCMTDVNWVLGDKYGMESKGIWAKHWVHGMNGCGRDISEVHSVYIVHDITEEQAEKFYEVFGKDYNITPASYNPHKCFCLYEKGVEVFNVTITMKKEWSWRGIEEVMTNEIIGRDKFCKFMEQEAKYFKDNDYAVKSMTVEQIF